MKRKYKEERLLLSNAILTIIIFSFQLLLIIKY